MTEKYYTPNIEDLFVGYEFEFAPSNNESVYNWQEGVVNKPGVNEYIFDRLEKGRLRTVFLTKEQIKREGWEETSESNYRKGDFSIYYERNLLVVYTRLIRSIYDGKCPSVNEFRKISKLLGI